MPSPTALLVFEAGRDPGPAVAWVRAVVPGLARLQVLVWAAPASGFWAEARWLQTQARLDEGEAALASLREALGEEGPLVGGEVVTELDPDKLLAVARDAGAMLVAWGPMGDRGDALVRGLLEPASRAALPLLMVGAGAGEARPVARVLSPWRGDLRQLPDVPALLGAVGITRAALTVLALPPHDPTAHVRTALRAAGVPDVEVARLDGGVLDLPGLARSWLAEHGTDLIAVAMPPSTVASVLLPWLVRSAPDALPAPLLVAPAGAPPPAALHTTDLLLRGVPPVLRVESADRFGSGQPWSGTLQLQVAGQDAGSVDVRIGRALLPELAPSTLGFALLEDGRVRAAAVRVRHVDRVTLDLVDASLPADALAVAARALPKQKGRCVVAVRVSAAQRLDALRKALGTAGLGHALVLDAAAELDDGGGDDLPARVDSLRLVRLARHLRADGARVDRVALRRTEAVVAPGLALWTPGDDDCPPARADLPAHRAQTLRDRLDALTGSHSHDGCSGVVHLSSSSERRCWLAALDSAERSVCFQTYIVEDDAVAERICAALAATAARGVAVRVLVDSLLSRWSTLGARNPLLERLGMAPGVELREYRPIQGVPDLDDLKQRDHRKVVIIDDERAFVTGRNLGAQYLTDLDEALVTPVTPTDRVPWLDAGIELRGPVVRDVLASFQSGWRQSGGAPFTTRPAGPVPGPARARLVVHEGLRDTHTVDAYRALFDGAEHRLWIVNTFPLQQELLLAAERALHRGVDVRVLVGNVRPVYGDRQPFPGGPLLGTDLARELATQVIHGRLDRLARAGATVAEVARTDLPGWNPALGTVRPHVHAKLVVVDGRITATGSANLDVTAGYWESEVLVVLRCHTTTAGVEAWLQQLLDSAVPFDPTDESWRVRAERRAWLSQSWPSVVG